MDNKQHYAALFIDHSKTFDTVDHTVLKLRLFGFLNKLLAGLKTTSQTELSVCKQRAAFLAFVK